MTCVRSVRLNSHCSRVRGEPSKASLLRRAGGGGSLMIMIMGKRGREGGSWMSSSCEPGVVKRGGRKKLQTYPPHTHTRTQTYQSKSMDTRKKLLTHHAHLCHRLYPEQTPCLHTKAALASTLRFPLHTWPKSGIPGPL